MSDYPSTPVGKQLQGQKSMWTLYKKTPEFRVPNVSCYRETK